MYKLLARDLCTIHKSHIAPTENRDLIALSADLERALLGCFAVGFIDIINAVAEPYATVAAICLDRVNGFSCACGLDAFGCDLVAGLIGDAFAAFKGHTVVVFKFENRANVNHNMYRVN